MNKLIYVFVNETNPSTDLFVDLESVRDALQLTENDSLIALRGIKQIGIADKNNPQDVLQYIPPSSPTINSDVVVLESLGETSILYSAKTVEEVIRLRKAWGSK